MIWKKGELIIDSGEIINAQEPIIISASRSTDIPAFYSDWFFNRLKKGYVKWKNPFNGLPLYVSFKKTRLIVFWSKNPKPIIKHLDFLDDKGINYYFQFTLNDYDNEKLETNVPSLKKRIRTFIELSDKIGNEKVIWRFDPYILTHQIGVDELLRKTENIGNQLEKYTDKLVFSFADIKIYKKVLNNLKKAKLPFIEFNESTMNELASGLMELNTKWNFEIGTCAESIDLNKYGIVHNKCIDDDLMIKLFHSDNKLMDFLGVKIDPPTLFDNEVIITKSKKLKDKGQRKACGCIMSKDIGQYNTCPHECLYCYANTSVNIAKKNYNRHRNNPNTESIIGE